MNNRKNDLVHFYELLDLLEQKVGGRLSLSECDGRTSMPLRGVYFFMEPGEHRVDTGHGLRIVRVGTHGLKLGSKSTLWGRLSQHKGAASSGGGNLRGSIFRLLVGTTIPGISSTWGQGSTAKGEVRLREKSAEQEVSAIVRNMPFLYLDVDDAPASDSMRGFIERHSIALLSNLGKPPLDPSSSIWRGLHCNREKVRLSGLWNQNHVDEIYDPSFLQTMEFLIKKMCAPNENRHPMRRQQKSSAARRWFSCRRQPSDQIRGQSEVGSV